MSDQKQRELQEVEMHECQECGKRVPEHTMARDRAGILYCCKDCAEGKECQCE